MNKLNDDAAKGVLETQQQQQESGSENEESGSNTDRSSSMSECATTTTTTPAKTTQKHHHHHPKMEFSVQRSDADGLRMKISAIRPIVAVQSVENYKTPIKKNTQSRSKSKSTSTPSKEGVKDNDNNNIIAKNTKRKSNKKEHSRKERAKAPVTKMSGDAVGVTTTTASGTGVSTAGGVGAGAGGVESNIATNSVNITAVGGPSAQSLISTTTTSNSIILNAATNVKLPVALTAPAIYSDATESGCSEATTTTVVHSQKLAKKVKVKRKKAQSKVTTDVKKNQKKSRLHSNNFSSDSEDEPLQQLQNQQRAPRLLLTAINSKQSAPQLKPLNILATNVGSALVGSDNIGISSSDNELPQLVSAAIKRVESDTDDTVDTGFRKAKAKHVPQYQSTLLQDFMEKTQMLGQPSLQLPVSPDCQKTKITKTESIDAGSGIIQKKRRGRPKKGIIYPVATEPTTSANVIAPNINESADSGVISTTSTTQSTTPSPKLSTALLTTVAMIQATTTSSSPRQQRKQDTEPTVVASSSPIKSSNEATSPKPKLDIAYLDKRIYAATERVLYPPRNKRRQSSSALLVQRSRQQERKSTTSSNKITKEELQLDPVWRKIDVNKKFRRPSVTSGYKSDGGGGNLTICSKILAAKSGYVSDYGSCHPRGHHNSGYKSDASCKSRYSTRSCISRRSRAKSIGYRSDCKESRLSLKSSKFRRKRRNSVSAKAHSKSMANISEDQDILQLAGLSLGQSSEESNEYVNKPNLESLPTTSVSKKYGEINRFIATGEYFGRGTGGSTFSSINAKRKYDMHEEGSQDGFGSAFNGKLLLPRKATELTPDLMPSNTRKIKSRRSSAASYCSSYYSNTSRIKHRRKRRNSRFPSISKCATTDSKLLTEIEIITSTFASLCRIQNSGAGVATGEAAAICSNKEKQNFEQSKSQNLTGITNSSSGKREGRDKRTMKKRKMSESIDFALLSSMSSAQTPGSGSTKRRHKKTNSSSPDDHKLPLKKRHYLLTPGEKSTEAAAKLFANTGELWPKSTASAKTQQQSSGKSSKAEGGLTPKKRHLLQNAVHLEESNSSPLRIVVDNSISGGKLLDISPASLNSLKQSTDAIQKKRRLEGLLSKIAGPNDEHGKDSTRSGSKSLGSTPQPDSEASCPPPGVFEPTVELEIQIPPITKLAEATAIITKAEAESPLLLDTKTEGNRVVEALLTKTGANIMFKKKRKKINRTGFPTVKRKKRRLTENLLLDITPDVSQEPSSMIENTVKQVVKTVISPIEENVIATADEACERVPQNNEPSINISERINRTPRLSVVSLERLQGAPTVTPGVTDVAVAEPTTPTTSRKMKEKQATVEQKKKEAPTKGSKKKAAAKIVEEIVEKKQEIPKKTVNIANKKDKAPKVPEIVKEEEVPQANNKRKRGRQSAADKKMKEKKLESNKNIASTVEVTSEQRRPPALEMAPIASATPIPSVPGTPTTSAPATPTTARQSKKNQAPKNKKISATLPTEEKIDTPSAPKTAAPIAGKTVAPIAGKTATPTAAKAASKTSTVAANKPVMRRATPAEMLHSKVKLPPGINPNMNFRCKIRLNRRDTLQAMLSSSPSSLSSTSSKSTTVATKLNKNDKAMRKRDIDSPIDMEAVTKEAKAKEFLAIQLEHDVLPLSDAEYFDDSTDTSDEKSSTSTTAANGNMRKVPRSKKNYLVAGLFSDHFKISLNSNAQKSSTPVKKDEAKKEKESIEEATLVPSGPLLPPPPYCENFFRRRELDFELPFDIYWAHKNKKLPPRVASWNYRKLRVNIYADSVRPNLAGIDHPTCNCKLDVGCDENCLNRMVYTECSPSNCPTREKCRNQKIQRHEVAPGVERFMTEDKGWGVRTKLPIKKGTYILEYVGEVVTEREFKERMGTIYLNDIHHYCLHLDGGLVIDGHRMGSDGRFVNHSCEPNCEMQKWSVNGLSRMALFAKRNIDVGEELTYDYNFALFNPAEGQPCRCKTPQCRGVIGGKSQRIKPLPTETKSNEAAPKILPGRQRKHKAHKNKSVIQAKDVVISRVPQLTEKEKKLVQQRGIFLIRVWKAKRSAKENKSKQAPKSTTNSTVNSPSNSSSTPATITSRRPSTPASLAAQLSALMSPSRSIKTRGLTLAVQDPEVEKMAKIAIVLRDICTKLETLKDPADENVLLKTLALNISSAGGKKKKAMKVVQKQEPIDLKTVQANIEQGYYKQPTEFNADMQKIFNNARRVHGKNEKKLKALATLVAAYETEQKAHYKQLIELVNEESALAGFQQPAEESSLTIENGSVDVADVTTEDVIRCICGLHRDEGLMIQCARCMVWQHTECTKADINADNYHCERCEPRDVDREIPLEDFNEDGYRYYLSLMRGDLQVRQGDAVYVLRDIPVKDAEGKVIPQKKHTYETIGHIDYNECDIFRVERLWKNDEGKRFIFGHHFLRPHETFHEPSRRFYPNEVVRVPLYEVVPIELVIARCWVLDRTTFCKGRPVECNDENHCYICELRVDKTARLFAKVKSTHPICTKTYAFRKFPEKLKISKTYAPHEIDPQLLKPKKQKTETNATAGSNANVSSTATTSSLVAGAAKKPAATIVTIAVAIPQQDKLFKQRSARLENAIQALKLKTKNTQKIDSEPPLDASYLMVKSRKKKKNS